MEVKKTCAVLYCGFIFQSFSSNCTLLSEGVMKYTPETESKGSLFFSRFSTTAAHQPLFVTDTAGVAGNKAAPSECKVVCR